MEDEPEVGAVHRDRGGRRARPAAVPMRQAAGPGAGAGLARYGEAMKSVGASEANERALTNRATLAEQRGNLAIAIRN